jgi:hypothetical protein
MSDTITVERAMLLGVIRGLMLSENMGDVHDVLNALCLLAGVPKLKGSFWDWEESDWASVGVSEDEE